MVASVTHQKVSTIPPTADPDLVSSNDWNDEHEVAITAADVGAAPNSGVDYLVGTASGSLTGEIVAGTSPGGELGGTWASPTVDATHSGSTHGAAVTTHEAAADPHTGYVREDLIDAAGDLIVGTADNTVGRLGKGSALQVLRVNAGATALEYATPTSGGSLATDPLADAKGDLFQATAADTVDRLAAGTAGQVLGGNATDGLSWQAPPFNFLAPTGGLSETMPFGARMWLNMTNLSALTSGQLLLTAIYLPKGMTITSISYMAATTGLTANSTHLWFALYSSGLVLRRQSTDDTSANPGWTAQTVLTKNLSSTYTTTTAGLHYVGIMVAASAVPTLRGFAPAATQALNLAPIVNGTSSGSLTGTAPDPAGAMTVSANVPYAYVS